MEQKKKNKNFNKKELAAEIKNYFLKENDVAAVYIFGSFLTERFNEQSDLDLAVIFSEDLAKFKRFKLKLKILYELEKIIERELDLLDFESVDLKMKHQVLGGRLLYCRDRSRRVILEKRAILNYINMRKRYELIDKNLGKGF